ncbi:MAG: hypothetical protein WC069_06430 [Candidatus Shapirobacteria bacterium]|nr:hypothetical protein [Terrimicrobiaceae bacterium]
MKTKTYNLGAERPDYGSAEPANEKPEKELPKKMVFPSFYISELTDKMEIPSEGEATIKFKVVERRETERDGKSTCSYDLEVHSLAITEASGKPESNDDEIEAGLKEAEKAPKNPAKKTKEDE